MRKIIIASAAFVLLMVTGVLAFQYLSSQKKAPAKRKPEAVRKFVQTRSVNYDDISTDIVTFGRVRSAQPLDLITEVSGRIEQVVPLKEGQSFRKGQLLFKINDTEARLTLKAQKSTFLKDIASILPDFKIDFPESYAKWESYFNSIDVDKPLPELPKYSSSKEKTFLAVKNILTNYYNIRQREENLKKHSVYAPFSGTIAEVLLQNGAFTNPGGRVARVLETTTLELRVPVETSDIRWIKQGTKVQVSTEDNLQQWSGRVTRIGDLVNENTQSLNVFVSLSGSDRLYEGMYLKAVIPGNTIEDALEIPRSIVTGGNKVFVIEEDSILRVQEVEVLKINAESMVVKGLEEGSDLVVEPLAEAYNGMTIFRLEDAQKYRETPVRQAAQAPKEEQEKTEEKAS